MVNGLRIRRASAACAGAAFAAWLGASALAQDGGEGQPAQDDAPRQGSATRTNVPDPTQPSPELLRALGANPQEAQAPAPAPPIPEMTLRGRIISEGRPAAAIVEIGGELLVVREGTELTVSGEKNASGSLTIAKLTAEELRIEVADSDRTLILR